MDFYQIIGILGFGLAAFSVISNDVIQTLGTFLSSNRKKKWWVLWLYAGFILSTVLIYGWIVHNGEVTFGRLSKIPFENEMNWWYLLPPLVLILITRWGIPVSTTFMILTVFSAGVIIDQMIVKSVFGYALAFTVSFLLYLIFAKSLESDSAVKHFNKLGNKKFWTIAQWFSTGFLWAQWLIQDFANIYVYLPRKLTLTELLFSLFVLLVLLALIFSSKGGKIQKVVLNKFNSENIRSATIIDLCYGIVLYFFTEINNIPMSTTWTFIGVLGGREIAIRYRLQEHTLKKGYREVFNDLGKVFLGLILSILLAYFFILIN